jgi:hypothetical protein
MPQGFSPRVLLLTALGLWRLSSGCCWCRHYWCDWRCCSRRSVSSRRSRYNDARSLCARRAPCEWQQSDVARSLDRHAQPALVPCTNARHAARQNLAALLYELRQNVRALVVDHVHLLDAELANFLLAEILALAARPATRTAWTSAARSAFTPRTTMSPTGSVATMTTRTAFTPRSSAGR